MKRIWLLGMLTFMSFSTVETKEAYSFLLEALDQLAIGDCDAAEQAYIKYQEDTGWELPSLEHSIAECSLNKFLSQLREKAQNEDPSKYHKITLTDEEIAKMAESPTIEDRNSTVTQKEKLKNEEPIYTVVDEMPEFPGGHNKLVEWIGNIVKYPVYAQEHNESGRVLVQFVINKNGQVSDLKIAKTSGYAVLDHEALRVVNQMPKWSPGKLNGRLVRVYYTLPFSFGKQ